MEEIIIYATERDYIPTQQTDGAFAYDLRSREKVVINPGEVKLVKTGVKVKLPKGIGMLVYSRSSLPFKKKLIMANGVGIIDSDYRGEVGFILMNISNVPVIVLPGERLGQCVYQRDIGNLITCNIIAEVVSEQAFNDFDKIFPTERGAGGYGSTGQ